MAQSVCSFQPTVAIILWVKPSDSVIRTWYHVIRHVCHFSSWLVLYLFKFSLLHTPWTTYSIIVKTHFMVTSPCLISGMMSHFFLGSAACGCVPLTYIWHTCIAMVYIAICVGCMSHMTCMTHICHGSADELDELITFSLLGWWRFILLGWTWLVRLSIIYIRVVHVL